MVIQWQSSLILGAAKILSSGGRGSEAWSWRRLTDASPAARDGVCLCWDLTCKKGWFDWFVVKNDLFVVHGFWLIFDLN